MKSNSAQSHHEENVKIVSAIKLYQFVFALYLVNESRAS